VNTEAAYLKGDGGTQLGLLGSRAEVAADALRVGPIVRADLREQQATSDPNQPQRLEGAQRRRVVGAQPTWSLWAPFQALSHQLKQGLSGRPLSVLKIDASSLVLPGAGDGVASLWAVVRVLAEWWTSSCTRGQACSGRLAKSGQPTSIFPRGGRRGGGGQMEDSPGRRASGVRVARPRASWRWCNDGRAPRPRARRPAETRGEQ